MGQGRAPKAAAVINSNVVGNMQKMRLGFIIILLGTIFCSCRDNASVGESATYRQEELIVYKQLMDALLDSAGYEVVDTILQVFYLYDTLDNVDYTGDQGFMNLKLDKRTFSIPELAEKSKHKYIKATDTLRVDTGEYFTSRWLTISRVCFDKEMNKGFFHLKVWCGNLCSQTDTYEVEKVGGQWKIKNRIQGPVS